MALSGPLPRAIALRMSSVAVRQMPSSIGSVEFSMKKSAECSTKPRPVSTGPPLSTLTSSARTGSSMRQRVACVRQAIFGIAAAHHQRHHAVADLPALDVRAECYDFAGDLEP